MLDVRDSRELQAAVLLMKTADKTLRADINKATRETMNPVWRSLVEGNLAGSRVMQTRVLGSGVRIAAGNPPAAKAAQSRRAVGSGRRVVPARDYAGYEFGADRNAYSRYERRSKNGGTHTVERRTMRHLPPRRRQGFIIYPAFAEIAPRAVSLWVQIIVKKYMDAAEGRR